MVAAGKPRKDGNNMKIIFNSKTVSIPEQSSLCELMSRRNYDLQWSLVSINDRIIRHEIWEDKIIRDGDRVDVLSFTHLGEGI